MSSRPGPELGKRRGRLRLLMGLITFSASLLVLEGGIRLDDWWRLRTPPTGPSPIPLLQENPSGTGSYRLRPNLDIKTQVGDLRVRIRTNAHGMHWRETSLEADPGRPRVAFLGDSFTFGSWVSDVSKSLVGTFETVMGETAVEALTSVSEATACSTRNCCSRSRPCGSDPPT